MNRAAASVIAFVVTIGGVMGAPGGAFAADKFVIALPNGYEMVRAKSGEPSIVKKRGSVVVPAPIKAFAVVRNVVTGEMLTPESNEARAVATPVAPAVAAAPAASPPAAPEGAAASGGQRPAAAIDTGSPVFTRPPPNPSSRYFVLDTRTGVASNNLSVQDWEAQLKQLEITAIPELAPPILPK